MPATYEFKFHVGQELRLREIDVPARVDAVMVSGEATEYRVVYWWDGARRSQWVYEHELREVG